MNAVGTIINFTSKEQAKIGVNWLVLDITSIIFFLLFGTFSNFYAVVYQDCSIADMKGPQKVETERVFGSVLLYLLHHRWKGVDTSFIENYPICPGIFTSINFDTLCMK